MTIRIAATSVPTYYTVFPWHIEQKVGTFFEENSDFQTLSLPDAKKMAINKGLEKESRDRRWHHRYRALYMFFLRIRALRNEKIRLALEKHDARSDLLKALENLPVEEKLRVDLLPDTLELNGVEVPMGTLIWWVDKFSMRLSEDKVQSSSVAWYKEPLYESSNSITYICDRVSFSSVDAENTIFEKMGQHYFFIKDDAVSFVKQLMKDRITELELGIDQL